MADVGQRFLSARAAAAVGVVLDRATENGAGWNMDGNHNFVDHHRHSGDLALQNRRLENPKGMRHKTRSGASALGLIARSSTNSNRLRIDAFAPVLTPCLTAFDQTWLKKVNC